MRKRGGRTREPRPDCIAESVVVAAAADRLLAGMGGGWHQITAAFAREATVRGGGRTWVLRCSVRLEGVEGGRFLASVSLWSGHPEAPWPKKGGDASPQLLEFVGKTQRRLRSIGFAGRFQPEMGSHWPGGFSRWVRGVANLERTLASLERLERSMGAVTKRADPTTACLAWGDLQPGASEHKDCPVVVARAQTHPALCACDCLTCQRAWWDMGRPMQQGQRIVTASGKVIA